MTGNGDRKVQTTLKKTENHEFYERTIYLESTVNVITISSPRSVRSGGTPFPWKKSEVTVFPSI